MPVSKRYSSAPPATRIRGKDDLRPLIPPVSLDQEPDGDARQAAEAAQIPARRHCRRPLLLLVFLPHTLWDAPAGARLGPLRLAGHPGAPGIRGRADTAHRRVGGVDRPARARGADLYRSRGRLSLSRAHQPPHPDPFQTAALPNCDSVHGPAVDAHDQPVWRPRLDSRRGLVADLLHLDSPLPRVLLRADKADGTWHEGLAAAIGNSWPGARPCR